MPHQDWPEIELEDRHAAQRAAFEIVREHHSATDLALHQLATLARSNQNLPVEAVLRHAGDAVTHAYAAEMWWGVTATGHVPGVAERVRSGDPFLVFPHSNAEPLSAALHAFATTMHTRAAAVFLREASDRFTTGGVPH